MARERMVTRTITSTEVTYKAYNLSTDSIDTLKMVFTGEDNALNIARQVERKVNGSKNLKFLKVTDASTTEELYAMTEEDFLKYAVKIEKGATRVPKREEA